MTTELRISGMNCQHCVGAVTQALEAVVGVGAVDVDLTSGIARIQGDAPTAELRRAVVDAGYGVDPATPD